MLYALSEKDGLTDNVVNCFFQDSQGIMWMGTNSGLNSFDGSVVTRFVAGNKEDDLPSDAVNDIHEDDQHRLWIATGNGLACYEPSKNKFSSWHYKGDDADTYNRFYSLAISGHTILLATERSLVLFNYDTHQFSIKKNNNGNDYDNRITKIFTDTKKQYWLGTYNGLWKYEDNAGSFSNCSNPANDADFDGLVTDIFEDHAGRIWFGNWSKGLKRWNGDTHSVESYLHYPGGNTNVTTITEQRNTDGNWSLWLSNNLGWLDEKTNRFIPFSLNNGAADLPYVCNRLFCDRNNLLWISTNRGIRIYNPAKQFFKTTILSNYVPLTSQGISLFPLDGKFLLGGEGSSSLMLFADSVSLIRNYSSKISPAGAVMNMQRGPGGDFWICTSNGLLHFDAALNNRKLYMHGESGSIPKNFLNTVLVRRNGDVWVMPWRKGAWLLNKDDKFSRVMTAANDTLMPEANIAKAVEDKLGNIWLADYTGGLYKYEQQTGKVINVFERRRLSNLYIVGDTLWTVSSADVLCVDIRSGKTGIFPLPTGRNKYEYDFIPDEKGYLWIATKSGLLAFNMANHRFRVFTEEDGLFANQMDVSFTKLSNGDLLFAGGTYATVFSPAIVLAENPPAPLLFRTATAGKIMKSLNDNRIDLAWNESNLSLNWALLNFSNPLGNQYFCKLDGVDADWQQTGNHGQVNYNSLAPGTYLFRYKAASSDGMMTEEKNIRIVVHPPFWKTGWFITLAVLIAAGLFFLVVRYVSQRNLKERLLRLEKEQAVEKERNRISRDMHDELGSGLTRIAILSEVIKKQKEKDPGEHIDRISETARDLVDNLDEMVWALNPKNDSLDKLIAYIAEYTNQYLDGTGIQPMIELPEQIGEAYISEEKRRNVFLTVKEFLNNSVKHSGAKNILLRLTQHEKQVQLLLKDDGRGFEKEAAGNMGNGLRNMQQRIADIGGKALISSSSAGTSLTIEWTL